MYRIIIPLLQLIAIASTQADPINSFMGVPWDAPIDSMRSRMQEVPGIRVRTDSTVGKLTVLEYRGGSFAGYSASKWTILYFNGKLANASVALDRGGSDVGALHQYRNIILDLDEKYGKPVSAYRETQLPGYHKSWNDIDITLTIMNGKHSAEDDLSPRSKSLPLYQVWRSKVHRSKRELRCECTGSKVNLTYKDLAISGHAEEELARIQGKKARKKLDDL